MRWLRLLALAGAVALVYLARILFLHPDPQFLADWMARLATWANRPWTVSLLQGFLAWPADSIQDLAWAAAGVGALLFGALALPWPRVQAEPFAPPSRSRTWAWALVGLALLLAAASAAGIFRDGAESQALHVGWVVAVALFLLGAAFLGRPRALGDPREWARPEAGWPVLVMMLAVSRWLFAWRLDQLPLRVDGDPASHGLQALALVTGAETGIFAPGWAHIPLLAYYPAAWGMRLVEDWLVGNRLAGVYAGLLGLVATWLLACELFRRRPTWNHAGVQESDGRVAALVATALTGLGYTYIHFSRLPQYMEPVAWGTLALWALYRGLRTRDPLALALSGLLNGLVLSLYYSGRVYPVIGLAWLIWIGLLRPEWIRARLGGLGWRAPLLWLGGMLAFLGPILGYWLREPAAFLQRMQEVSLFGPASQAHMATVYGVEGPLPLFLESLKRSAFTFNFYPDTSTHFGWQGPMLDDLTGPLLLLGLGLVVLNLDRLLSWLLLSGFLAVVVLGGGMTINAPFWPRLLPALPFAGLLSALAVDRLRRSLLHLVGPWLAPTFTGVMVGLLVLAGLRNFVAYADRYSATIDPATAVGRGLRELTVTGPVWVFTPEAGPPPWDDRVVDFLTAAPVRGRTWQWATPATLPDQLPPNGAILLLPDHREFLADLHSRYPGGHVDAYRTRRGDPYIYIYWYNSTPP